jgi:formylglycine-generating enzyme required for sulfatase activity
MKFKIPNPIGWFDNGAPAIRSYLFTLAVGTSCLLALGCKNPGGSSDPLNGMKSGEMRFFGIHHDTNLEFRWVPAGIFVMGSPDDEMGRNDDEEQKTVRIKHGFWIAETETTVGTWQKVMNLRSPLANSRDNKPATHVSWFDCRNFLKHLKAPAPGWKYELPTEIEWEYACRAGSNSAYPGRATELGWIRGNSGNRSHRVGTKTPNAWLIHDMHGNVAEWCRDRDGANPIDAAIRGGSWASDFSSRAAARNLDTPYLRSSRVGFRLILVRVDSDGIPSIPTKTSRQLL